MYRIGVDLGGTNIAVGLVNDDFQIVSKLSCPTGATRAPEEIIADMAKLCEKVCALNSVELKDIASIGIASPGIADTET